jgi:uncharacterized membrane protein
LRLSAANPSVAAMKTSRAAIVASAFPSLLMLGLFYSLAVHMHSQLGAWPQSIGDRGFSAALIAHGEIAVKYCSVLLLVSMVVVPIGVLVCLLVPRFRFFVRYFAFYALVYLLCWVLILLAPASFLNWWWD